MYVCGVSRYAVILLTIAVIWAMHRETAMKSRPRYWNIGSLPIMPVRPINAGKCFRNQLHMMHLRLKNGGYTPVENVTGIALNGCEITVKTCV